MSTISTLIAQARAFVTTLRSSIWAIDVRDGIGDSIQKLSEAIEQCYSDVSNPTLQTEALEAALQNKIDEGEMAALTIGDHTITAAKLAQGVIDNTLSTSGAAADAKKTGDEIAAVKADLGSLMEPQRLVNGTDLNTVTTPGTYTLHTSVTYINKPTSDTEHGILEVWHEDFNTNQGRTFQRLTYTYKAGRTCTEIWARTKAATSGATWTPWVSTTGDLTRKSMLLSDDVPDTTQAYTFTDGKVSQVTHSRNSVVIRTDAFTYGTGTITEVRTLNTGESLTIVTNLTTLETTVTYNGGT